MRDNPDQPTLFNMPKVTRQPPRVLMKVFDAAGCDYDANKFDTVRLECRKCGHKTEWIRLRVSEAKRGTPCPECNKK